MEYINYNSFIDYLLSLQDNKYLKFQSGLTFTNYKMIGIRVPILRDIAKQILNSDYKKFLREVRSFYYEEVFIEGLVIAGLNETELMQYLPKFIIKIDDWGICDSFCHSLKIVRKDYPKYFNYFKEYLNSNEEFMVRVGLVVLLKYYVKKEYIEEIFTLIDEINLDRYYVNMAIAWLISEVYIKFPQRTKEYLQITKVNEFTFKKSISKICDSYRVSDLDKEELRGMIKDEEETGNNI